MNDEQHYFDTNRELWNAKTESHLRSAFYDVDAFKAGKSSLNPAELEALGDVSGRSLLHLQCHFGMDTLSWARMGADATGIDLSNEAIAAARKLSEEINVSARFIESNVYDIAQHLAGEAFDIVFTSYGTIVWLPDLDRWAEVIDQHLKPGGTFCFAEFHPVWDVFDWDTFDIAYSYFGQSAPYEETPEGTYADESADIRKKEYFWIHSLGEIIGSLRKRGLIVKDFSEYDFSYYNCFPHLVERAPGEFVHKDHAGKLPMMFRLVMEKPQ